MLRVLTDVIAGLAILVLCASAVDRDGDAARLGMQEAVLLALAAMFLRWWRW